MGDTTAGSREGSEFGPYRLRRLVGRGGMGDVYEAEDTVRERIVALKLMSEQLSNDRVSLADQREARTAARLHEPHVVPIHDFGEIDGQLYVDMRLIDGRICAPTEPSRGRLIPAAGGRGDRQVASALDAAHARRGAASRRQTGEHPRGSARDFGYLIDFGIARATSDTTLTQIGHTMGTFAYMAPERFRGRRLPAPTCIRWRACSTSA